MQRRRVLAGFAAGMSLFAGCGGSGDGGSGNGGGNNTTQSSNGGGTPLEPATPATSTPAATTIAETTRETATQTATATPAPTSTPMSTPAATPAATPMPTAGPTEAGTAGPGTAIGSMDIDLSERETYSNDDYSYTIEYPTEWSVDDSDPTSVSFTASASPSVLTVIAQEGAPSSLTLDQAAESFLSGYQQSTGEEGSTETLDQEDVTLPNDHPARLFDFRLSSSGVSVRQKAVITLVDGTMYAATIVIPEGIYTSSVGEQADEILTSLTVSGGSTTTTSS